MSSLADRSPDPGREAASDRVIARLTGIEKSYPGVKALRGVDFDICAGEIHCLVGENGAGKSTLIRVLAGAVTPDSGTIEIDGRRLASLDPAAGIAFGIGVIYQELDLVPALSVAENIFLGHEPAGRLGTIDKRALNGRAMELLGNFDVAIPPSTLVRELGPAQRQLVQIAKALSHENRILVLDEPTASLTDNEVEHLFDLLRRLRARGLGLIYISHRLEEVLEIGDRVTVLRDGAHVMTGRVAGMTRADIISAMVGRPLGELFPRSRHSRADEALSIEGLTRTGEFRDITFSVREGEVLALAGLVGAGRSELLETLFGIRHPHSGQIRIKGKPVTITSPRAAIRLGLGFVPEERRETGLVLGRSVGENLVYPILDRLAGVLHLKRSRMRQVVDRFIEHLAIKTPSSRALAGRLSGGNQQKIVVGKWLAADSRILLLDEPTRGVDVNAKAEIYRLIDELAQTGVAVIVASSELPEVLGISDRVLVLSQGHQAAMLETARTSQVEIMHYGVAKADAAARLSEAAR